MPCADAEQAHLLGAERFDDARQRLRRHGERWLWLDMAERQQAVEIAHAQWHLGRYRWRDAEALFVAVTDRFPQAVQPRLAHVAALGADSTHATTGGAIDQRGDLTELVDGPLDQSVGDTLLAGLERAAPDSEWAVSLREILLDRYREPTIASGRAGMASDDLDERWMGLAIQMTSGKRRTPIIFVITLPVLRALVDLSATRRTDHCLASRALIATRLGGSQGCRSGTTNHDHWDNGIWSDHATVVRNLLAELCYPEIREVAFTWVQDDGDIDRTGRLLERVPVDPQCWRR